MPKKIIANFKIEYLQILDENGRCDGKLMPKEINKEMIKDMYKWMVISRAFDEKELSLQRQGRIGTFAQIKGQEASQVGAMFAAGKDTMIFPSFREQAAWISRGLPPENILEYYGGDERGNANPREWNFFAIAVPVGSQIVHAVGYAMAMKYKKDKRAVIVYFGDGATSEGDFYEGLNFSGVFKAPVVFMCQNNQYAISLPRSMQSAAETLAQKAIAAGITGIQIDGNDVFAVYAAVKEAVENAKKGKPTLIECVTYRLSDHTTADDALRYRSAEEVEEWKKKDPIDRLRKYMEKKKIWSKDDEAKLKRESEEFVNKAVERAESIEVPKVDDIFAYTYAEMTPELKEQLEYLRGLGGK